MTSMKSLIDEHLVSSAHLAKKHVHPKLMKMMEIGGMASVFRRGQGQYLYDLDIEVAAREQKRARATIEKKAKAMDAAVISFTPPEGAHLAAFRPADH